METIDIAETTYVVFEDFQIASLNATRVRIALSWSRTADDFIRQFSKAESVIAVVRELGIPRYFVIKWYWSMPITNLLPYPDDRDRVDLEVDVLDEVTHTVRLIRKLNLLIAP